MPELPEVETIVGDLKKQIVGSRFITITATYPKAVEPGLHHFHLIQRQTVTDVYRRGKFICIRFDNKNIVTIHLRMSGRIVVSTHNAPAEPFERVRLDFNTCSLRFSDIRKFGRVWIGHENDYQDLTGISKLGPEPLADSFSFETLVNNVKGRKGVLKKILLDQTIVAGIGNIYADEICFDAGIRPHRGIDRMTTGEWTRVTQSIKKILKQGIENRGTSISDFHDAHGEKGFNQDHLKVYGRAKCECYACQTPLKRFKIVGRGTVYCPKCQL